MCMIVDANVLGMFLLRPEHPDIAPIYEWLRHRGGSIVYSTGGKFKKEIDDQTRDRLTKRVQAGQARQIPWDQVEQHEVEFGDIRSNDSHILALACTAGVRLLYTRDKNLRRDFKNEQIIDGAIYRDRRDAGLLTKDACAGGR